MRVLILARPKFQLPPDQLGPLMEGFAAWRERYRSTMEAFEFFAGGGGGFGIVDVADEAALNQMMLEWPLLGFSDVEVRPIVNGDTALRQWREAAQAQTSAMS